MSINCNDGISIPTLENSPCLNGIFYSDNCTIHAGAITALNLPANSSLNTIVNALVLAIQYKEEQIQDLQSQINALTP